MNTDLERHEFHEFSRILRLIRADSDKACILKPGEHPFVKHETCVNYGGAKVISKANLELLMNKGYLSAHAAVTAAHAATAAPANSIDFIYKDNARGVFLSLGE